MKLFELAKVVPDWIPGDMHEIYEGGMTVVGGLIFTMILCSFFVVFFSIVKVRAIAALSYCIGRICTYSLFFPFYFIVLFFPTLYYCRPQTFSDFHPHPFFFGGIAIYVICGIISWMILHENLWGDFVSILNSIFKESDVIKFRYTSQYIAVAVAFLVW